VCLRGTHCKEIEMWVNRGFIGHRPEEARSLARMLPTVGRTGNSGA
jgi:hypothetical protein